jgi:hypothetical protein
MPGHRTKTGHRVSDEAYDAVTDAVLSPAYQPQARAHGFVPEHDQRGRLRAGWTHVYLEPGVSKWVA